MSKVTKPTSAFNYKLAENVFWVVEDYSVKVKRGQGSFFELTYPQAAIWDLMSRKHPIEKIISILKYVVDADTKSAHELVRSSLEEWSAMGVIEKTPK